MVVLPHESDSSPAPDDRPPRGVRRLRRLRTRCRRRARHVSRAVRAAAPGPGVGRYRGERRRDHHGASRTWVSSPRCSTSGSSRRSRGTSRSDTCATPRPGRARGATRSRCTARSAMPDSRSGTTATSPTPRSSRASSGCCPACSSSDSELIGELLDREYSDARSFRRARSRDRAAAGAPASRRRVLARVDGRSAPLRRA